MRIYSEHGAHTSLKATFKKLSNVSANTIIVMSSAYLVLALNLTLLLQIYHAVMALPEHNLWFLASVPVLFISLFVILISSIVIGPFLKPAIISLIMMSSVMAYATSNYGVIFDFSMVQNIIESDSGEALSYLNFGAFSFIVLTGIIPSLMVLALKLKPISFFKAITARVKLLGVCAALIALTWVLFFANYAAIGRNNHQLVQYITPFKFINSAYRYTNQHYFSPPDEFVMLDKTPIVVPNSQMGHVTVLVLGETARAQSFSLNGYTKDTNPLTKAAGVVSFQQITSCGTATAVSVPCMFSQLTHDQYTKPMATRQQNVVDIAQLAGMDVLWIDNNNGSCKGVCARINTIEIKPDRSKEYCDNEYCLDQALLAPLANKLAQLSHKDTLIVLHMMGSHGPTYYRRYPADKRVFSPDCPRSDIQHCSMQSLVNTYDNTIA